MTEETTNTSSTGAGVEAGTQPGEPTKAIGHTQANPPATGQESAAADRSSSASAPETTDNGLTARVEALEDRVDSIEHAKVQAVAAAAVATPRPNQWPTPSLGRTVIARYPHRQDAPAIVTFVHSPEVVDLQIFRGDHLPHNGQQVSRIDPSNTDGTGWFWPPRT